MGYQLRPFKQNNKQKQKSLAQMSLAQRYSGPKVFSPSMIQSKTTIFSVIQEKVEEEEEEDDYTASSDDNHR